MDINYDVELEKSIKVDFLLRNWEFVKLRGAYNYRKVGYYSIRFISSLL